jgi:hypothetical protein
VTGSYGTLQDDDDDASSFSSYASATSYSTNRSVNKAILDSLEVGGGGGDRGAVRAASFRGALQ